MFLIRRSSRANLNPMVVMLTHPLPRTVLTSAATATGTVYTRFCPPLGFGRELIFRFLIF